MSHDSDRSMRRWWGVVWSLRRSPDCRQTSPDHPDTCWSQLHELVPDQESLQQHAIIAISLLKPQLVIKYLTGTGNSKSNSVCMSFFSVLFFSYFLIYSSASTWISLYLKYTLKTKLGMNKKNKSIYP